MGDLPSITTRGAIRCIICQKEVKLSEDEQQPDLRVHINTIHFGTYRPFKCNNEGCGFTTGDPVLRTTLPNHCCQTEAGFRKLDGAAEDELQEQWMNMFSAHSVLNHDGCMSQVLNRMETVIEKYKKVVSEQVNEDIEAALVGPPSPPSTPIESNDWPEDLTPSEENPMEEEEEADFKTLCFLCNAMIGSKEDLKNLEIHADGHPEAGEKQLQKLQTCFGYSCYKCQDNRPPSFKFFRKFEELLDHFTVEHLGDFKIFGCLACKNFDFNFPHEYGEHKFSSDPALKCPKVMINYRLRKEVFDDGRKTTRAIHVFTELQEVHARADSALNDTQKKWISEGCNHIESGSQFYARQNQ